MRVLVDSRLAHQFPDHRFGRAARGLRSTGLELRARRRRVQPPLRGTDNGSRRSSAWRSRSELRQQPAADLRGVLRDHPEHGAIRVADASLYAGAAGFSVEGDVGFDVLVQLLPPHFIADFHAKLQLKRGSHNLFKVTLRRHARGPAATAVSGKATFEILWCDFSVRFDSTLVTGRTPPLPAGGRRARRSSTQALAAACELEHAAQRDADARRGAAQPAARSRRRADRARPAGPVGREAAGGAAQHASRHRDLRRRASGGRAASRYRPPSTTASCRRAGPGGLRARTVLRA